MIRIKSQVYEENRDLEINTTITDGKAETVVSTYTKSGPQTLLSKKHDSKDINVISYLHDQMISEVK